MLSRLSFKLIKFILVSIVLQSSLVLAGVEPEDRLEIEIRPISYSVFTPPRELFLIISYWMTCHSEQNARLPRGLPGYQGTLTLNDYEDRQIRFELFQGKNRVWISLGVSAIAQGGKIELKPFPHSGCVIEKGPNSAIIQRNFSLNNPGEYSLALRHSPYLVVRKDQYENRLTDLPLELIYSVMPTEDPAQIKIRYTYFFSDEDSKKSTKEVDQQMARYGRMTDIEWIYEVTLDRVTGKRLGAQFQGNEISKLKHWQWSGDHSDLSMQGKFWGADHPILYNIALNNVFLDQPYEQIQNKYVAYQPSFSEDQRVDSPHAREAFQHSPQGMYMSRVSEIEIALEGRLSHTSDEYLYLGVGGILKPDDTVFNLHNAAFIYKLELQDAGVLVYHTQSAQSVDRLGEDLHKKQAIAALQVSRPLLDGLWGDALDLNLKVEDARPWWGWGDTSISITLLEIYRLVWNREMSRYEKVLLPRSSSFWN